MTEFSIPVILSERTSGSRRKAHGDACVQTSAQNRVLKRPTEFYESLAAGGARGQARSAPQTRAHRRPPQRPRGRRPLRPSPPLPPPPRAQPHPVPGLPPSPRPRTPAPSRASHGSWSLRAAGRALGACALAVLSAAARLAPYFTIYLMVRAIILNWNDLGALDLPFLWGLAFATVGAAVLHGATGYLPADALPAGPLLIRAANGPAAHGQARPHPVRPFQPGAPRGDQEGAQRRRGEDRGVHRPQPLRHGVRRRPAAADHRRPRVRRLAAGVAAGGSHRRFVPPAGQRAGKPRGRGMPAGHGAKPGEAQRHHGRVRARHAGGQGVQPQLGRIRALRGGRTRVP